jgi:hypothetical protein
MATLTAAAPEGYTVTSTPYPARTKTSSLLIKGLQTTATAVDFADKILITVTQNGRLAHWVCKLCIFEEPSWLTRSGTRASRHFRNGCLYDLGSIP